MKKNLLASALLAAALIGPAVAAHAADPIRIGYQTNVDPAKVDQADGLYDKAFGRPATWVKFDSGAEVNAAIAGGSIDIGLVGSSPLAVAASNKLPIETFLLADLIGDAEALVVRNAANISKPEDLVGKTIAVPFVSTTHYSLLAALKHWNIDAGKLKVINLKAAEIPAAWARGDIDGAYVWDPALGAVKPTGHVLVSSKTVATWGAPTFDAWIVRKDFAAKNPDVVAAFARVTGAAYARYLKDPAAWVADKDNIDKVARLTGSKPEDVAGLLAAYTYPSLADQASPALLGGDTLKAVASTAEFLKEQGKVPEVLADYSPYVTAEFVRQAAASN
jgi:taurine transport system substrate-binding protein